MKMIKKQMITKSKKIYDNDKKFNEEKRTCEIFLFWKTFSFVVQLLTGQSFKCLLQISKINPLNIKRRGQINFYLLLHLLLIHILREFLKKS